MIDKKIIIDSLIRFVSFVLKFENELTTLYGLKELPYNEVGKKFERVGEFMFDEKLVQYKFHGAGCLFICDEIVIDYNINPLSKNHINISSFKFLRFLKTYSNNKSVLELKVEDMYKLFLEFERMGILNKVPETNANYAINMNWYISVVGSVVN